MGLHDGMPGSGGSGTGIVCYSIDAPLGQTLTGATSCPRCGRSSANDVLHPARDWLRVLWLPLLPLRISAWSSCSACSSRAYRVPLDREGRTAVWDWAQRDFTYYTSSYNNTFWASWPGALFCAAAGALLAMATARLLSAPLAVTAIAGLLGWAAGGAFCRRTAAATPGVDGGGRRGLLYGVVFWSLFPVAIASVYASQPLGVALATGVVFVAGFLSFNRWLALDSLASRRLRRRFRRLLF